MSRQLLTAVVVVVTATLLASAPAAARGDERSISMLDNHYLPSVAVVAQAQRVTFTNFGGVAHDAWDGSGLQTFDTGVIESPDSVTVGPLPGAGDYRYYCTFHPEMFGRLRVPVTVSRAQSPAGAPVTVRWAAVRAPDGMVFDVQRRLPGTSRFVDWRTGVTAAATRWWPSIRGQWALRARVAEQAGVDDTGWSPVRTLRVT